MTKPNFFILGFPKCGTTALASYLADHPEIFFCSIKEPHFFSPEFTTPSVRVVSNEEQYGKLFQNAKGCKAIGEGSTLYIYSDRAIGLIENVCNTPKYIVLIRNPLDMVQSEHAQMLKSSHETIEDFYEAWKASGERIAGKRLPPRVTDPILVSYKEFGRISKYVDRLLKKVESDRVKFVVFEDMVSNPRDVYLNILDYLGVEDDGRSEFPKKNERAYHRSRILAKFINNPPKRLLSVSRSFKDIVGVDRIGFIEWLRKMNLEKRKKQLSADIEREVRGYFANDKDYMEQLLGRKLPW